MMCTDCKYPDSRVVYTRHFDQKNSIERRRECLRCGVRFTTREQLNIPSGVAANDPYNRGRTS